MHGRCRPSHLDVDGEDGDRQFFVDDEVLAAHGVTDLSRYNPPGVADVESRPTCSCRVSWNSLERE